MRFTCPFTQLSKNDVAIAGGKGASLGELTKAGIPVPPGFVILSQAFEYFIEKTEITADIDAILHKVKHEDINSVEKASEEIKAIILSTAMPKEIEKDILQSYKQLNAKWVAVRSSATSEDSSTAAWAGQLDSFLNTTDSQLLENVKRCWASLFTPRAIFYRFEKNLHNEKISVAVVVQKMVESEVSGIAFSVHPVTQDYNQLIIEAGIGLGEAIVSGQITPDSYVVEKKDWILLEKNVAEQTKALIKKVGGGNEWVNLGEEGKKQKLSDEEILELSKLIIRIEKHYGFPVDIEWAFEKGKFYIVQSRPITTLTAKEEFKKPKYHKHQRDYTLLGTSLVFEANCNKKTVDYFSYKPNPMFILIENGILYHFMSEEDSINRSKLWVEKYSKVEVLLKHKKIHDIVLKEYREFLSKKYSQPLQALKKIHQYFADLLPMILVAIEIPEYAMEKVSKEIIDICMQIRKENEDVYKIGFSFQQRLLEEVEKENSLEPKTLSYLTSEEFRKFVDVKELPIELKQRRKFVLIRQAPEGESIYYDRNSLKNFDLQEEEQVSRSEFNGNVAYPGKVKGKVRIIRLLEDANKLEEGEILVTSMTDPRYVSIMKKAAAIITDEGGVTCHAAIVSRELKKPCIIGTKVATQVLRDGDMVEVDANNGIVKILERKK